MKKHTRAARRTPRAAGPVPEERPSSLVQARRSNRAFHIVGIVGIGASAGGLEALELFLANVPKGSGMAFVIVQHLRADEARYTAKQAGGNRIATWSAPAERPAGNAQEAL